MTNELCDFWAAQIARYPDDSQLQAQIRLVQQLFDAHVVCSSTGDLLAAPRINETNLLAQIDAAVPEEFSNFRRIVLARVIEWGNSNYGWNIPIAPFRMALKWSASPFTPRTIQNRIWLREVEHGIFRTLDNFNDYPIDEKMALALVSATVFGGLVESTSVRAFLSAIPAQVSIRGTFATIDVHPDAYRVPAAGITRRPLDPLTTLILLHIQDSNEFAQFTDEQRNADDLWTLAVPILANNGADPRRIGRRFSDHIAMCKSRLHFCCETLLADFAEGTVRSYAAPCPDDAPTSSRTRTPTDRPHLSDGLKGLLHNVSRILGKLKHKNRTVREQGLTEAKLLIAESTGHWEEIPIRFLLERITKTSGVDRRKATSTASRYWYQGIKQLLISLNGINVATLDSESLQHLYEQITTQWQSTAHDLPFAEALRRFHKFARGNHRVANVSLQFLRPFLIRQKKVKAVSISEKQFVHMRDALPSTSTLLRRSDRTVAPQLQVIATVSHRAGPRLTEVLALHICDLRPNEIISIIIRSNDEHHTKSAASERMIPLTGLLTPPELEALIEHWSHRVKIHGQQSTALLFADARHHAISKKVATRAIREALFQATGNRKASAHSLRHNFPATLVAALAYRHIADANLFFGEGVLPSREYTCNVLRSLYRCDNAQLAQIMPNLTHAFAQTMGHHGTRTMLESYTHGLHLALAAALAHSSPSSLSIRAMQQLMNISQATAYRYTKEYNASTKGIPFLSFLVLRMTDKRRSTEK